MQQRATDSRFRRRPTVAGDDAFLRALEADRLGLEPHDPVAELQFRARQQGYRSSFPDGQDFVILVGEEPAGRLMVTARATAHHVVDLALLAAFRGRGIGTALMRDAQVAAADAGVPLELTVFAADARLVRWYEGLGFVPAVVGDAHLRMVWTAPDGD